MKDDLRIKVTDKEAGVGKDSKTRGCLGELKTSQDL